MLKFGEMPEQDMVTEENKDMVAHCNVMFGDNELMVSDTGGTEPFKGHSGFAAQISFDSADAARAAFDALAEGGTVTMPFAPTFWSEGFGYVTDKFGVN